MASRIWTAVVVIACWGIAMQACAAPGLQITQVTDTPPHIAVFLAGDPAALRAASQAAASPLLSAALGTTALPIKSSLSWDASDGITLVVALDVSASIGRQKFDAVKKSVASLVAGLSAVSRVALIAIGAEVRVIQPFGPPADVLPALDRLVPDSPETALYEAVLAAQELAARAAPDFPLRRLVVVLTDGLDDSRRGFGREEALQRIERGDAPIFALGLASTPAPATQREALKSLAQLARASGGGFVQSSAADAGQNLDALMHQAAQTQLVTLDCAACLRDGVVRSLQVSVQRADGTVTGARDVRLLAPPPKPVEPTTEGPPSKAPSSGVWFGLLGVSLAGLSTGLWIYFQRTPRRRPDNGAAGAGAPDSAAPDEVTAIAAAAVHGGNQAGGKDERRITLDVSGQGRMPIRVGTSDTVLGRARSADVVTVNDAEASSRHAALFVQKGALMVRDLGSANGTYLNGVRIGRPEPVQDRDLVFIGRTEVRVYLDTA